MVVVDWPWASRGPAWLDTLLLLNDVCLYGGHDVDTLLTEHAAGVDPDDLTAVLAGFTGYCLDKARLPAAAGLPTVQAFQRAQGEATLTWLRHRLASGEPAQRPRPR